MGLFRPKSIKIDKKSGFQSTDLIFCKKQGIEIQNPWKKFWTKKLKILAKNSKIRQKFWSFSIIFYDRISYLFLTKTIFLVTLNTFKTSWGQNNFGNSKKFKFLEKFQKLPIFLGKKTRKKNFCIKILIFFCYIC